MFVIHLLCPTLETADKKSGNSDAVEEILTALRRRGPDGLDALVASLEAEEDVHANLIAKIRAGVFVLVCVCVCVV